MIASQQWWGWPSDVTAGVTLGQMEESAVQGSRVLFDRVRLLEKGRTGRRKKQKEEGRKKGVKEERRKGGKEERRDTAEQERNV